MLFRSVLAEAVFYSLWGHLEKASLPVVGTALEAGTVFARLGDYSENGDWFFHTHLQVLTEKGLAEGFISKGYCSTAMLPVIDQFCPSPLFLLRW